MKKLAIDSLRYAQRLEDAGIARPKADAMAHALNDELADHMLTKTELTEALQPIYSRLDAIDQRFETVDARFESMDARFDAMDTKIGALDAKFEAKFDSLSSRISMLFLMLAALIGIGMFQFLFPRTIVAQPSVVQEQQAEAPPTPLATGSPASPQTQLPEVPPA